jgi:UDP-glucose 4-epimerase
MPETAIASPDPRQKVLITGGAGFIGAAVARALLERGTSVVVLDQRAPVLQDHGDPIVGAQFVCVDVLDALGIARAMRDHAPARLVHTAAIVGAGLSIDAPVRTVTTNVVGLVNVLEAARMFGIGRTVFVSSQSVYGPGRYEPVDEKHPTDPDSPYGMTKLASEKLGNVYHSCFGLDFVSLRMAHIYGPGRPGGLRGNFIQEMLEAAQTGARFTMNRGGEQTKEPSHIADVAAAVCAALDVAPDRLEERVFNVGSGEVFTWNQIAAVIREMYPSAQLELGPGPIEVRSGVREQVLGPLDCRRAEQVLGVSTRYRLRDGLSQFAQWLERKRGH